MLADRVLVQQPQAEGERRSRSGILIPATAQVSRRLAWAEVVAVGPHVRSIKVGDKVLFNPEDRLEVDVQGEEFVILRERCACGGVRPHGLGYRALSVSLYL